MIPAVGTPERREMDRNMILSPNDWPMWPKLPLKRKLTDNPSHGFVINTSLTDDTVEMKVYVGTIFEGTLPRQTMEYTDIDALLDDGWTVD